MSVQTQIETEWQSICQSIPSLLKKKSTWILLDHVKGPIEYFLFTNTERLCFWKIWFAHSLDLIGTSYYLDQENPIDICESLLRNFNNSEEMIEKMEINFEQYMQQRKDRHEYLQLKKREYGQRRRERLREMTLV